MMSLVLSNSRPKSTAKTWPSVWVQSFQPVTLSTYTETDRFIIPGDDFAALVYYFLTNTNLEACDGRKTLLKRIVDREFRRVDREVIIRSSPVAGAVVEGGEVVIRTRDPVSEIQFSYPAFCELALLLLDKEVFEASTLDFGDLKEIKGHSQGDMTFLRLG